MDGCVPWPEDAARVFRDRGYWAGLPIGEAFREAVRDNRPRAAVVDGERRVTFEELGVLVARLAGHLVARELAGAPIVFQLPNTLEFVVAYFACIEVGAVPICALPHHRRAEVEPLARLTEARGWFVAAEHRRFDFLAMVDEIAPRLPAMREIWVLGSPRGRATASFADLLARDLGVDAAARAHFMPASSDVAVLQLSGGTTGVPKLIPRTHDDYLYNARAFAEATSVDRDTVMLLPIPMAHNFPLACPGLQGALLAGAKVVVAASPSADTVLPLVARERVTWIPAVPATLIGWTSHARRGDHDLSSLRAIYVGGQRLNAEPARAAVDAFGPVVRQVYGMAEGLLCCTRDSDPADAHLLTQGRPMSPGDEVRAVGDDGRPVPPGELGEMECRGPYTIRGYFRAPEANRDAFTEDGFYRTGDIVRIDAAGYVTVEGRRKDLVNRGGEKISAEEIENLILAHPMVANAAVVAVADAVLGERVCACVTLATGGALDLPALVTFLQKQDVAAYKLPERLELFEKLPLTGVGKVSKKELRELVALRARAAEGRA